MRRRPTQDELDEMQRRASFAAMILRVFDVPWRVVFGRKWR